MTITISPALIALTVGYLVGRTIEVVLRTVIWLWRDYQRNVVGRGR